MRRNLLRIGIGLVCAFLVLALVISAKEKTIGAEAVEAIRPLLATDLEVGGAYISIWRDFPYLRVGLQDVRLRGSDGGEFLQAEAVTSRLSWGDLIFGDDWVFNTVRLHNATVRIHRDQQRVGNWLVIKPSGKTGASQHDIAFHLSRIQLDNVRLIYVDEATNAEADMRIADGTLSGRFGSQQYTLTGSLNAQSKHLSLDNLKYLHDLPVAADFSLEIDLPSSAYRFGKSTITVDGMPVDVSGTFAFVGGGTLYDLELHTSQGQLGPLLRALPSAWVTPAVRSLNTKGDFALDGKIKGLYDERHNPAVGFGGSLKRGTLYLPTLGKQATDVSFRLSYTNDNGQPGMKNSQLVLSNLVAQLDGQPLSGNFAWTDFVDPFYDIDVSGTIPLDWFDELWEGGDFRGEVTVRNLNVHGRQRHLISATSSREVTTRGSFQLDGAAVIYHGDVFAVDALSVELRGSNLEIRKGYIEGHGDRLATDLVIDNLVPYLVGDPREVLGFRGSISASSMDLQAWVSSVTKGQAATQAAGGAAAAGDQPLVPGIAAEVRLSAGRLTYGAVVADRVTGTCRLDQSRLRLDGEAFAMEGHWAVDGHIDLKTKMRLAAKLACSEVNITELFEQTENVGQEVLKARNIEGQLTTRAFVEAAWRADGSFDDDQLHVWANVGVTDGELRDFEMLQSMRAYVRKKELEHVQFIDTENWIEVVGDKVYLPAMFIQSSASNFTVAGEHSFAHDINYSVLVNGGQTIMLKLIGKKPGADFVPDRRNGWWKMGISVQGSLVGDAYDAKLQTAQVRRHFRHSQLRKAAIRQKLIALFGPESLIDDYDDEGARLRHIPLELATPEAASAPVAEQQTSSPPTTSLVVAPSGKTPPERRFVIGSAGTQVKARPAVVVDRETYLDFDDEQKPANGAGVGRSTSSRPATTRSESSGTGEKSSSATPSSNPFEGLFNSGRPASTPARRPTPSSTTTPSERQTSNGDYLEGFDDPQR